MADSSRRALIAGATGLVGRELLTELLADARYSAVLSVGRRKVAVDHPKLQQLTVDFRAIPGLPHVNDVYIALGTTRKVAGSEAAMRAVDVDAVVAVAKAAKAAGAERVGVVSSMGANAGSAIFYTRIKGEMEEALVHLGFVRTVIARPSQLCGPRESLGQPHRLAERFALQVMKLAGPLVPANYRVIPAHSVALALLEAVACDIPGTHYLLSGQMQRANF